MLRNAFQTFMWACLVLALWVIVPVLIAVVLTLVFLVIVYIIYLVVADYNAEQSEIKKKEKQSNETTG